MSIWTFFTAIYSFASTSNLVKYFRRRYEEQLVQDLNRVLRLKGKCVRHTENLRFLTRCFDEHVVPSDIKQRVRKAKPKNSADIERAFLRDAIEKAKDFVGQARLDYHPLLSSVCKSLSFVDRIRFCKLVNSTTSRLEHRTRTKKDRTFHWLLKTQIGIGPLNHSTITNLSSIELTDIQKDVLCRGLDFGIPRKFSPEGVKAEFEECWQQLKDRPAFSEERRERCKSAMSALGHKYANAPLDKSNFPLKKDHLSALKNLRNNPDIVITKPDKGNGVVILDRSDYVAKMLTILSQESKFKRIGEVETCDSTLQQERALQAYLLRQFKAGHITEEVYHRIRPVGASRPRMYGLPKTHKSSVPLRPILSMTGAPQHELAKWLATVLQPVVKKYSDHTVKDTFAFCANIQACAEEQTIDDTFMCSFDVVSLFTNIPLEEALEICLDTLYRDPEISKPTIPEKILKKLLVKTTTEVEFSFDGTMYRQIDGVAMGSPLGPVLANIFMGFCEAKIPADRWPLFYNRFVDDTFSVFLSEAQSQDFFELLNDLHPSLSFTVEGEQNNRLPFMDVLVERVDGTFVRTVYRKPTFTGLYTRWDSFTATSHKVNLIKSLTSRARRICSPTALGREITTLKALFADNGYPSGLVDRIMKQTLERAFTRADGLDSEVKYVSLRLPWIGPASSSFRKEITRTIEEGFLNTSVRVFYSTTRMLSGKAKDALPQMTRSNVIYEYRCCCGRAYVGKTSQRLSERIRQHVPDGLLRTPPLTKKVKTDSAITRHLKEDLNCVYESQPTERFRILAQARSQLQLDLLEALFIKKLAPSLCHQKEFVRVLNLF